MRDKFGQRRRGWGFFALFICLLSVVLLPAEMQAAEGKAEGAKLAYGRGKGRQASPKPARWVTADHSAHPILQQDFTSPEHVTKACLSCHNEAAHQVHQTIHWTWKDPADREGQMGKNGLTLNNFCISIHSNEPRCTSCHVGYGWKNASFDFNSEEKVDCLVCHDRTGTYKKFPTKAGYPVTESTKFGKKTFAPPDYRLISASVGRPSRDNCGVCHFFGGGGDAVKHGDLDSSLFNPSRDLDVHMNAEGSNFNCQRCHTTEAHFISGRTYKKAAFTERKSLIDDDLVKLISCESCHTEKPHKSGHKANDHTDKVACQSCHIPAFARVIPTKMQWDWSQAGRKKNGKPYKVEGKFDKPSYDTKKGSFVWEKNVTPEYFWYNGRMDYVLLTDTIDATQVVKLNRVLGHKDDADSRITPFKVHRGKQPYDKGNSTMAVPHLFGKDQAAYWKSYDWNQAITAGMQAAKLDYSGEYGFVETEYHYPITHMVAPAEKSLRCADCHAAQGRLAKLGGFYMPGRDRQPLVDTVGWLAVAVALLSVAGHGLLRLISGKKGGRAVMTVTKLYLYTRFERFWHWMQGVLILLLLVSGFEVHGVYRMLGFEAAFTLHNTCAWAWFILYAFIVFWIVTTGEWKHYVPTFAKMFEVIRYYSSGIFRGEDHPVPKSERVKHNPLQRITYLGIVSLLVPFQMVTGFLYYYYNRWPQFGWNGTLSTIAVVHTVGAFAFLIYLTVHVYMITTGHTLGSHLKAMFTGYEKIETGE